MDIFELFKMWVNHPKEGSGRSNLDNTDECWKKLLQDIRNWENSEDKYENEVAKYLLFTGKIRRVHIGLDEVNYNNHYVSWTSAEKLEDIYWFNSSCAHTIITAEATRDNPGISVKGFIEVESGRNCHNLCMYSPFNCQSVYQVESNARGSRPNQWCLLGFDNLIDTSNKKIRRFICKSH